MKSSNSHIRKATPFALLIGCGSVAMLAAQASNPLSSSTSHHKGYVSSSGKSLIHHEEELDAEFSTKSTIPSTTTTTDPPATTTTHTHPPTTVAATWATDTTAVPVVRTTVPARPATSNSPETVDWYALATCESGNGRGSSNQYQFMGGTAEKVGIDGSEPIEEQTAAAQRWAAALRAEGKSPGSTAGWPVCWWRAGGS